MTPGERERMAVLCERIAKEQNRHKFTELVQELNDLLDLKDRRLELKEPKWQYALLQDKLVRPRSWGVGDCPTLDVKKRES
jgi:hypothetical protein